MTEPTETELKLRREITNIEQQVLEQQADNIKLRKQIEFITLTCNEAAAKVLALKKTNQELTNEMVLIKGITVTNSPELRDANKKIKELEKTIENLTNPVQKARESGL